MDAEKNKQNENGTKEERRNAFNNIKFFLCLLLLAEIYTLLASGLRMFFDLKDCSPQIAGIYTVLIPLTVYHIWRLQKSRQDKRKPD